MSALQRGHTQVPPYRSVAFRLQLGIKSFFRSPLTLALSPRWEEREKEGGTLGKCHIFKEKTENGLIASNGGHCG